MEQYNNFNRVKVVWLAVACIAFLFYACGSSKSHVSSDNISNQLIGVWKNVSPGQRGEMIKVITKNRFVWTWAFDNNTIVASARGTYTFDGETYTETIECGTQNQGAFIGKKAIVKLRFEGNNKFYSSGILADSMPLNEVWERIE